MENEAQPPVTRKRSTLLYSLLVGFILICVGTVLVIQKIPLEMYQGLGGFLALTIIGATFAILCLTIIPLSFYISYRIDKRSGYPLWVELPGIILGVYLGFNFGSFAWTTLSSIPNVPVQLLFILDPWIVSIAIFFSFIYICFKFAHFIYAKSTKRVITEEFKIPLILGCISLGLVSILTYQYFSMINTDNNRREKLEAITITDITESANKNSFIIDATVNVPEDGEYEVVSDYNSDGTFGGVQIDGEGPLMRHLLTKGAHRIKYFAASGCYSGKYEMPSQVTFNVGITKLIHIGPGADTEYKTFAYKSKSTPQENYQRFCIE